MFDVRAGADHLMMLDPHSPQLEGFFDHPVDCLKVDQLFFLLVLNTMTNNQYEGGATVLYLDQEQHPQLGRGGQFL